jgi:hypothetical protein
MQQYCPNIIEKAILANLCNQKIKESQKHEGIIMFLADWTDFMFLEQKLQIIK